MVSKEAWPPLRGDADSWLPLITSVTQASDFTFDIGVWEGLISKRDCFALEFPFLLTLMSFVYWSTVAPGVQHIAPTIPIV